MNLYARAAVRAVCSLAVTACFLSEASPPPVIKSFNVSLDSVARGDAVALTWEVEGATSVWLDPVGPVDTVGQITLLPDTSSAWTLLAGGPGGQDTAAARVYVAQPPTVERFEARPSDMVAGGQTTLAWSVTGADSVRILPTPGWTADTILVVTLDTTTSFGLTAVGRVGATTATQLTVTVRPAVLSEPTSLEAYMGTGSVALRWPGIAGALSYELQRTGAYDTLYQPLATPDSGSRSYFDGGLTANSVYRYRLRAQTAAGPTVWLTASSLVAPPPPEGPTRGVVTPSQVTLAPWATQAFSASPPASPWFVFEGVVGGRVSADGLYQAPSRPGVYHLAAMGSMVAFATIVVQ